MCSVVGELLYDPWRITVVGDGGPVSLVDLFSRCGVDETDLFRLLYKVGTRKDVRKSTYD
jgi:hypothetical protein